MSERTSFAIGLASGMVLTLPLLYGIVYVFRRPIRAKAVQAGGIEVRRYLSSETSGLVSATTLPGFERVTDDIVGLGIDAGYSALGIPT